MNRVLAVLQYGVAALLSIFSIVTLVNMVLIALRPETISVVNAFVGQIVLIACMLALAKILYKKGKLRMQQSSISDEARPIPDEARPIPEEARPIPEEARPIPEEARPISDEARPISDEARSTHQEN